MIDLRSDTVTRPTAAMRSTMAEAVVGDDVFGEDPTVRQLQERIAELLGKEAGLFVPSGVMGNQLAIKVLTRPGDEMIVERQSHIFNYETGAPAVLSGVQLHVVDGEGGVLHGKHVLSALRPGAYWDTPSRLVCLENTLNKAGGRVYPLEATLEVAAVAREHGLRLHLDGARLWNAAAATGTSEAEFADPFDSVSVCLSKGLGAPIGSVLAGSAEFIEQARHFRKMFGGGMRQVGMLAAAGIHAIDHQRPRLREDHEKARKLAEAIAELDAFFIDLNSVETNIVIFHVRSGSAADALDELASRNVLMVPFGPTTIRATTHRDVSMEDVETAIEAIRDLSHSIVSSSLS